MKVSAILAYWRKYGMHRRRIIILGVFVTLLISVLTLTLFIANWQVNKIQDEQTRQYLLNGSNKIKKNIEKHFYKVEKVNKELSNQLANKGHSEQSILDIIENVGAIYDGFSGIGAAYSPYSIDDKLRLFSPYMIQQDHGYEMTRIDLLFDYTADKLNQCVDGNWYNCAVQKQEGWLPLQFDEQSFRWVMKDVLPIKKKDKIIGYSFVNIDVSNLYNEIEAVDLGDEGYAIIFDQNNNQIYHSLFPNAVKEERHNFKDYFKEASLISCEPPLRSSRCHFNVIANQLTQVPSYLHVFEIAQTQWKVAVVIEKAFFAHHKLMVHLSTLQDWVKRNPYTLTLFSVLTVLVWVFFINMLWNSKLQLGLWGSAFIIALSFVSAILYIWFSQKDVVEAPAKESQLITSDANLRTFVRDYSKSSLHQHKEPPIFIPTGITVQSAKIDDDNNLLISGYVWQRYLLSNHYDIGKGLSFPESIESKVRQIYIHQEGDYETIGWTFRVKISGHFIYKTYPFDKQTIWLRLWPKDYRKHVILIPDAIAYDNLNTSSKPGLEESFSISGWQVKRAFFDIRFNDYNSTLGIDSKVNKMYVPELYYNIQIGRNVIDPFVSYLFPVVIVLLMLYAVLLTNSRDESRIGLIGFNALEVLASCSALFFVALLAHVELRSHIGANELIYMEYFFIIAYTMVLIVSVNSILFSWGMNIRFVQYADNALPKLLYWPLLTGLLFIFTLMVFW
ncbi:hypothetical protein [uncultured Shewanella sp.]|uniref:hypothetical protein n=1 Tax=uncultured Shewanella sp. TaxID=173975 RepID=UPI00260A4BD8|nr:hypothetical protein [uncultured Shewanella sp.]